MADRMAPSTGQGDIWNGNCGERIRSRRMDPPRRESIRRPCAKRPPFFFGFTFISIKKGNFHSRLSNESNLSIEARFGNNSQKDTKEIPPTKKIMRAQRGL